MRYIPAILILTVALLSVAYSRTSTLTAQVGDCLTQKEPGSRYVWRVLGTQGLTIVYIEQRLLDDSFHLGWQFRRPLDRWLLSRLYQLTPCPVGEK